MSSFHDGQTSSDGHVEECAMKKKRTAHLRRTWRHLAIKRRHDIDDRPNKLKEQESKIAFSTEQAKLTSIKREEIKTRLEEKIRKKPHGGFEK